jgi:hypothetical protein
LCIGFFGSPDSRNRILGFRKDWINGFGFIWIGLLGWFFLGLDWFGFSGFGCVVADI